MPASDSIEQRRLAARNIVGRLRQLADQAGLVATKLEWSPDSDIGQSGPLRLEILVNEQQEQLTLTGPDLARYAADPADPDIEGRLRELIARFPASERAPGSDACALPPIRPADPSLRV